MALPDKIFPVEFGGYWEFASDYTYEGVPFGDVDKYPEAQEFAYECAKRYNDFQQMKRCIELANEYVIDMDNFLYSKVVGRAPSYQELKALLKQILNK